MIPDVGWEDNPSEELSEQVLRLLETLLDEMARRATVRHKVKTEETPLWIDAKGAAQLLGAGYTPARVKQLGHAGELICDRKDPDKPNSPYVFLRASLLDYTSRRVFQLEHLHPPRQYKRP